MPRPTGAIGRAGALAHHAFELLLLNRFVKLLAVIEGCYHVQTRHQPPTHRDEATQDCLGAWGVLVELAKKPAHHGEVLGGRTCQRALPAQFHWPIPTNTRAIARVCPDGLEAFEVIRQSWGSAELCRHYGRGCRGHSGLRQSGCCGSERSRNHGHDFWQHRGLGSVGSTGCTHSHP